MAMFDDDNLGLIGGLAQGVKAGIQGYMDAEDRSYNRKIMAAKMKAAESEALRKKDDDDIELAKAGYRANRDPVTGLIKRSPEGRADIVQDPELTPTFKPLHPIIEQEKNAQIRALGEKPIIEQQKLVADKMAQGFEPQLDEAGKIVGWKMSPWKSEQEAAETEYKKAMTAKAKRKGGGGPATPAQIFKNLPPENQEEIKKIAGTTANQKTIRNQLKGDLAILNSPNVTPELKLVHARSMIKTLNSKNGADAVGSEESKRLAGLLEFRVIPRVGEPGPLFGRADMSEFTDQVNNMMSSLESSIKLNADEIQSLYGRAPILPDPNEPAGKIKTGLIGAGPKGLVKPPATGNAKGAGGTVVIQRIPGVKTTPRQDGALDFIMKNPDDKRTPLWIKKMQEEGVIR